MKIRPGSIRPMAPLLSSSSFIPNFSCGPCIYCYQKSDGKPEDFLKCEMCQGPTHIMCLKSGPPVNRLKGDNFFTFNCIYCSSNNEETVQRVNISILHGMLIALYNLHLSPEYESSDGYYHYKNHIHAYMMTKWKELFDFDGKKVSPKDKTRLQPSCISGLLSQSSYFLPKKVGRGGWYRLAAIKSPATLIQFYQKKKRTHSSDSNVLEESKKLKNTDQLLHSTGSTFSINIKKEAMDESPAESLVDDNSSRGSWFFDKELIKPGWQLPSSIFAYEDDVSDMKNEPFDCAYSDSPDNSFKKTKEVRRSLFSKPLEIYSCSEKGNISNLEDIESNQIIHLSLFEEGNLLTQLDKFSNIEPLSSKLYRLRRKLKTRRLKREHGLPYLEIDSEVKFIHANKRLMTNKERKLKPLTFDHSSNCMGDKPRILDRFQMPDNYTVFKKDATSFKFKLVGNSSDNYEYIYSPYTLRKLKPFIYQDYDAVPQKLKLLQEIIAFSHRNDQHWKPQSRFPIDYCYVTHKHIPAMNQLARQFFWPGIELSEVLQYPDFSCVVLYAKLVIGFGVIVPDVSHNEAYISFLFVHPEWRRAGIAKFMLYHLIQTCPGKDVTLHVSATNPALIIYQQFGFKVEEFLTDFYYKYYEEDSLECKHAMFMRLGR